MAFEGQLEKLGNLEDVTYEATASVNGQSAKDIFCANWVTAKKALEAAQAMVKNPFVKLIIGILITVGDGLKKNICA
jgi:hypothetical protein